MILARETKEQAELRAHKDEVGRPTEAGQANLVRLG